MTPMLFISGVGALEGSLITVLRETAPDMPIFNVHRPESGAYGMPPIPPWAQRENAGVSPSTLARRYFGRRAEERNVSFAIGVGIPAILEASALQYDLPLIGIIPRGSVDFSLRRKAESAAFASASRVSDALFFDCHHDMDKASSHGSESPHFLLPLFGAATSFLGTSSDPAQSCIVVPHGWTDDAIESVRHQIESAGLPDATTYQITSSQDLFLPLDFIASRGFPGALRYRIPGGTSHMLLLGDSRDHIAILSALERNHPTRYAAEATIGTRDLALRSGISGTKLGQGAALFERFAQLVQTPSAPNVDGGSSNAAIAGGEELLGRFAQALRRKVPWWYEENMCDPAAGSIDIFYSVAAVENRADGARPLRIRSVSEAFPADDALTVRLTADTQLFTRRSHAIREMLRHGVRPRDFYGESSTAPMLPEAAHRLGDLLRALRPSGLRTGWFVRDLHWLSEDADYSANTDISIEDRIARGLDEVRIMQQVTDVFYAPSARSASMFAEMLGREGITGLPWSPLPPGVSEYRTLSGSRTARDTPVRLVYSGGYGDVYQMDTLVDALGTTEAEAEFSWFVRPADTQRLLDDLDGDRGNVHHRISNQEFLSYLPDTGKNLGLILLDGAYARNSFPFKLMSYLEKRMPVVVFDDMAVADFVRENGLGIVCERNGFTIERLLDQAESFLADTTDWTKILAEQSWKNRMETVRTNWQGVD